MTQDPTDAPHHAPPTAGLDPTLISDCVHCGFCLPACPTYQLWGEEMDSPRGRIELMRLVEQGDAVLDDVVVGHLDACLGCMACVTACPSGVAYDQLIEQARAEVEHSHERTRSDRAFRGLVFALFPYRRRLRVAAALARVYQRSGLRRVVRRIGVTDRLPPRLRALEALVPDGPAPVRLPQVVPAVGQARRRVGLITGCVQSVFFSEVNAATARVLAADGCEVAIPPEQGCCGALELHAGRAESAQRRARRLIATMDAAAVETIVINAAGCGSSLKEYGTLLADDPGWADRAAAFAARVRDITEVLAELGPQATRHPIPARLAYHDACHLAHAQRVRAEPRAVLGAIPGLDLVELDEPELCCGSAGIYNLTQPDAASELGRRKAEHVLAAAPDALATANPGCLLQLQRHLAEAGGAPMPLLHPVQLVDAAIAGTDPIGRRRRAGESSR